MSTKEPDSVASVEEEMASISRLPDFWLFRQLFSFKEAPEKSEDPLTEIPIPNFFLQSFETDTSASTDSDSAPDVHDVSEQATKESRDIYMKDSCVRKLQTANSCRSSTEKSKFGSGQDDMNMKTAITADQTEDHLEESCL